MVRVCIHITVEASASCAIRRLVHYLSPYNNKKEYYWAECPSSEGSLGRTKKVEVALDPTARKSPHAGLNRNRAAASAVSNFRSVTQEQEAEMTDTDFAFAKGPSQYAVPAE